MGYVLRVRAASFFAGASTASFLGLYILHNDYKVAHHAISQQALASLLYILCFSTILFLVKNKCRVKETEMRGLHDSFDRRISALEKLKQKEDLQPAQAPE